MAFTELKQRAALASVATSATLTLAKLAAGLLSGSLALTSDAGHAGLDTLATILTFFAVRAADKPADEEHHYGHAKIEAVAALAETGLLLLLALAVLFEALRRLWDAGGTQIERGDLAFFVLGLAIVVDFVRWRMLRDVAKRTSSHALAADALHFSSDCFSSALVLAGLLASRFGFKQGDAVAAIGVAVFIGLAGVRLGQRTVDALLDAAPKGASQQVRDAIVSVPGVLAVDTLRLRPSGAQVLGEVEVAVPRTMPIETAEDVRNEIARAISRAVPAASLTIAATPRAIDTETLRERVLLIAARRRVSVHHVTVQDLEGRKSLSLDVEIDGRLTHGAAHEIASALEAEIRAELGNVEVETHIEPLDVEESAGTDADPDIVGKIEKALTRHAAEGDQISEIHGVRARRADKGLMVNYHCRVSSSLTVEAAHTAVDDLDRSVREDFPEIVRIVGHAEPLRA
jgi:cation diffusion facilitator family transporter